MKRCFYIFLLMSLPILCVAQKNRLIDASGTKKIDSLKHRLILQPDDSTQIAIMQSIGFLYEALNVDSALKYYQSALDFSREKGYARGETRVMTSMSGVLRQEGKLAEALDLLLKSLKIAKENNLSSDIARANRRTADIYFDLENLPKAVDYVLLALHIDEQNENKTAIVIDHWTLADAYEKMNKLDSATFHLNKAFKQNDIQQEFIWGFYEVNGNIQAKKGNYEQAHDSYAEGLKTVQQNSDLTTSSRLCADLSALFKRINKKDSAIFYALRGFQYGQEVVFKKGIIDNGMLLAELYDSTQPAAALKYYKVATAAKDSLFGVNNIQTIQNLIAREEAKQKELEEQQLSYQNRLKSYGFTTGLAVLLIIAFILYRNNRHKQKANIDLQHQKEKVESTLSELKSTQAQLIQSEKMASLGELTAGIAHEIQNPLNFVNNFSEVNKEMLEELNAERLKPKAERDETLENELINDVIANEQKINHHGKRAGDIVKGMLQHSQKSTGVKEPTDINALADEYLRLSYQGLRAKDKNFNAELKTDFDLSIEKINIIPQDIGRVLLNLYNNAFYAVNDRLRQAQPDIHYEPTVSVTTKKSENHVIITVSDNGNGILQKIVDKIFQPFFTTKPTGQGTGLGLSLSYDIVKAHGGEIKVESKEGEGAIFIIQLPVV